MEIVNYPKMAEHKAQHRNILDLFTEHRKILDTSDNVRLYHYVNSYRRTILTHISVYDQEYIRYVGNLLDTKKKFDAAVAEDLKVAAG